MGIAKLKNIVRKWLVYNTYTGCDTLPIFNFNKLQTEGNFMWLVDGYDGYADVPIPKDADEVFSNIINEYCELTGNNDTAQYYELIVSIARLETRYMTVYALIEGLCTPTSEKVRKEIVKELHHWGFLLDESKNLKSEVERLTRQLRSAKTTIDRKKGELKEFDKGGATVDILDQKLSLERILEKDRINLKEVTVKEWLKMMSQADLIIKARKKK